MPLQYRVDILVVLKNNGYSVYALRKEKLLSESAIQRIRTKKPISWANLEQVCSLLGCQPGEILEFVPAPTRKAEKEKDDHEE